jgi:NADH-ubiquinone oxidoreductase chain 6
MNNLLLDLLAFGAILSSVLVITAKNPVIAVLFLISVFINAAGYLILLGVGFIGISYIIVYIGAITVLFLFVIMMINIKLVDILEVGSAYTKNLPLALAVSGLFIYEIFSILPFQSNSLAGGINIFALPKVISSGLADILNSLNQLLLGGNSSNYPLAASGGRDNLINTAFQPGIADSSFTNFLQIEMLGQGLYTYGALWLILSSVILLLAMIAPIILSKKVSA